MPYAPYLAAARDLRHEVEALAARFGVSFEQAAHRLSTLQRPGENGAARGLPFFFLRVDPAGNVDKRFSAAGFPFARFGGSCPKWIVHRAFATPAATQVQVAQLPDGATFLTFARAECRSRAFPPLEHRLALDPNEDGASPWRFEPARRLVRP
jgi:predicted transcriptional regulator